MSTIMTFGRQAMLGRFLTTRRDSVIKQIEDGTGLRRSMTSPVCPQLQTNCCATANVEKGQQETCRRICMRLASHVSQTKPRKFFRADPLHSFTRGYLASAALAAASWSFFTSAGVSTGGATAIVSLLILPAILNGTW